MCYIRRYIYITVVCTGLGEEHIIPVVKNHTFSSSVHGLSGGFDMSITSLEARNGRQPVICGCGYLPSQPNGYGERSNIEASVKREKWNGSDKLGKSGNNVVK